MSKLDEECEKREKQMKKMNSLARDTQIAIERHTKACEVLKLVNDSFEDKTRGLREELEAAFDAQVIDLQKGVNAARSEVGTAAKLLRDTEEKYTAAAEKLRSLLPVFLEESDASEPTRKPQPTDRMQPEPRIG